MKLLLISTLLYGLKVYSFLYQTFINQVIKQDPQ